MWLGIHSDVSNLSHSRDFGAIRCLQSELNRNSSNLDYLASYVYSLKKNIVNRTTFLIHFFSFNKDELSRYISSLNVNNTAMKLRKAALKARHQTELNDLRTRMQKEIDQSLNELKMASDIKRMQAVEEQVTWIYESTELYSVESIYTAETENYRRKSQTFDRKKYV